MYCIISDDAGGDEKGLTKVGFEGEEGSDEDNRSIAIVVWDFDRGVEEWLRDSFIVVEEGLDSNFLFGVIVGDFGIDGVICSVSKDIFYCTCGFEVKFSNPLVRVKGREVIGVAVSDVGGGGSRGDKCDLGREFLSLDFVVNRGEEEVGN